MKLPVRLISATLMMVSGFAMSAAIAAEPTAKSPEHSAEQTAQRVDVCQQAGAAYRQLYTIEDANRAITICQKANQFYYITTEKTGRLVVRYATNSTPN
jgi:fructose-1,6-bisphosphatase/sedoheptulose 1,7-bisphosphatase-like protein